MHGHRTLTALACALTCAHVAALDLSETTGFDFSNDRFSPTPWTLTDGSAGANGLGGNNVLSGSTGRATNGVVDLDYLRITVPHGYQLSALRVGTSTTSGGSGAFIALAVGPTMPLAPNATSAAGLLGWRHYSAADANTDILPAMGSSFGATGFSGALPSGTYSLWIQELATGSYNYRFNFQISPVPEPASVALMTAGWLVLVVRARRPRRCCAW